MTPVPTHVPMAVLTLPTLTGAHSPPGFGAGGLQPGECCSLGLAWECVLHPATLIPLAVPVLLPFPAGHAAAWESTGKPEGCQGGEGGFCVSSCPWSKQGIPAKLSPVHVRMALLSLAVTGCHWLLLFSQGLEFPASAYHRYFQVPSPARHLSTRPGPVSVPGRLTGTWPGAGEGPQGLGSAGGPAWGGVWGREIGVPPISEGFSLLSGGVGGLGFGGEYPSPPRAFWGGGCVSLRGSRSPRSAFPLQGSPPRPTEEPWVPWALEVSRVPRSQGPVSGGVRGRREGSSRIHPRAGGAGCAAGKYCGRKRK